MWRWCTRDDADDCSSTSDDDCGVASRSESRMQDTPRCCEAPHKPKQKTRALPPRMTTRSTSQLSLAFVTNSDSSSEVDDEGTGFSFFNGCSVQSSMKLKPPANVSHGGNREVPPTRWGLTISQFNEFIARCREDKQTWDGLQRQEVTMNGKVVKKAGYVSGYQFCEAFVKPFTRGTGSSVALLLNPRKPLEAEAMISHTWAEDMLELQEAINDRAGNAKQNCSKLAGDLVIWFCMFANYQCGGEPHDVGPTIAEQLQRDPFGAVIRNTTCKLMCLVVSSRQDPYERLWCVYELDVALSVMQARREDGDPETDGFVAVEFSKRAVKVYKDRISRWALDRAKAEGLTLAVWKARQPYGPECSYYLNHIDCEKATCSCPEDDARIRSLVEAQGGWARLNRHIASFRRPLEDLAAMN